MKIKWLGHACFVVTSAAGVKIVMDPYTADQKLHYAPPSESAAVVTVSHSHFDHNNTGAVRGNPKVLAAAGTVQVDGVEFKGIAAYHDSARGRERGSNTIFCFKMDGLRCCHLGDLGHLLSPEQKQAIGGVDVLFVPVGGVYTIDAAAATELCDDLGPKVIFPMHYKTGKTDLPLAGVEEFLKGKKNVRRAESSEIEVRASQLPASSEIVVLKPAN